MRSYWVRLTAEASRATDVNENTGDEYVDPDNDDEFTGYRARWTRILTTIDFREDPDIQLRDSYNEGYGNGYCDGHDDGYADLDENVSRDDYEND